MAAAAVQPVLLLQSSVALQGSATVTVADPNFYLKYIKVVQLDVVGTPYAYAHGYFGASVTVAVIDQFPADRGIVKGQKFATSCNSVRFWQNGKFETSSDSRNEKTTFYVKDPG